MSWWFYMVECRNGAYYCGITTDVDKRVQKHNSGKGAKAVRALGLPVVLAYKERCDDKLDAMRTERERKKWSHESKMRLVDVWRYENGKA